ncbi:o-succinylbenzoate synthase [Jeotgalibacillus sp. S-D1]|uniref:o-succinylbenzoate synthase n=1 Tax=Jeotgalibacillus sp. S-D1 TaxID=2552189 RepID=UPI00105A5A38|nr:o-succinylbenzoate synthase [Jeotgalibacillus sp. S-D1]TDL34173.1 o-succinylbenzoate synthase [Jeotgalibacillus sp. S-D1]
MKITNMQLNLVEMDLKTPFVTSLGSVTTRQGIIVAVHDESGQKGYGEAVAFSAPWYTEETVDTCLYMIKEHLAPLILNQTFTHPHEVFSVMASVRKNPMAKASIDMAVWDLYAKLLQKPLYEVIGGTRKEVLAGIAAGAATIEGLIDQIKIAAEDGYRRIKVKIAPGKDADRILAIRESFPDIAILADANSSYSGDPKALLELDGLGLQMIEQPLGQDDLVDHAALQQNLSTPICLDESIHSLDAAKSAIALKSCQIINIKIGRVGGLTEAIRIHDLCQQHGIGVWCGGMLEFGVSRAHNIALATLEGFSIPGDISSSARYWHQDITTPDVKVKNGKVMPFQGEGIGVSINEKRLKEVTIHLEVIK